MIAEIVKHPVRKGLLALAIVVATALYVQVEAEMSDELVANGWKEFTYTKYKQNKWYAVDNGVGVSTDKSVSILYRPVAVDIGETPILSWRWRISVPAVKANLGNKSGEDRALAVYVAFPFEPDRADFLETLERLAIVLTQGSDVPGRILTYAWGGDQPRGTLQRRSGRENMDTVRILRTPDTPANEWFDERVDVMSDFREAYGWDPPAPTHIGIASDSDDHGRALVGEVVDMKWHAQ